MVCRAGSQGSIDELISRVDPRLRFSRNYVDGMRPYAAYCEETIELVWRPLVEFESQHHVIARHTPVLG
jgi:hypothetical protein